MALGMRQKDLVADGGENDTADQQQMQISIREPPDAAGIVGPLDSFAAALGADIEVNPPHSDAAGERRDKRGRRRPGPLELSKSRPGDEDGLAKRDYDEEAATFGEMATLDGPVGRLGSPQAWHGEAD